MEYLNISEEKQNEICKWIQRGDETEVLFIVNELLEAAKAEQREKMSEIINSLKPDVNKMKHGTSCICDFEKMNILNEAQQKILNNDAT